MSSPCCLLLPSKDIGLISQWLGGGQSWVKCIKATQNVANLMQIYLQNGIFLNFCKVGSFAVIP